MKNFIQYMPTKIIFGKNTEKEVGRAVAEHNGQKVLIVYGGGSVVKSGLLKKVELELEKEGISYKELGGVLPNPRLELAEEGVRKALAFGADFILAVGGGSAIDTAKGIAHGVANQGDSLWDIWTGKVALTKSIPVGVVLTISAAGSETSDSAVLTNEMTEKKLGFGTDFNRPKFAIMNPELTYSLPKFHLTCGIVDIMMHTLERYLTLDRHSQLTDEIAEGVLRTTKENGAIAYENQTDYNAMSELMWAGSISHNGLTGLGRSRGFVVHKLGHEVSAMFDTIHGASLSALWGAWAKYVYKEDVERFVQYAKKVWNIEQEDEEKVAKEGIEQTILYFKSIGMPTNFEELGIGKQSEEVLQTLAERATGNDTISLLQIKELKTKDVYEIFKAANNG